jgi:hypothetical protein
MPQVHELYHGSPADGILSIINSNSMRPDTQHEVYFSERFEDALQHGADTSRGASFVFKAEVTIPDGASVKRLSKPGNPLTVLVTTSLPLATKVLELYVRTGRVGEFELKVIKGADAAKAYLLKGRSASHSH